MLRTPNPPIAMNMPFVPSPIHFEYDAAYTALANQSGRMQYYKELKGKVRERIGRNEFIKAFNTLPILAVTPIPSKAQVFQLQFFSKL